MTHPRNRIGPYEIVRELGRGGMGVVVLARDTQLDRPVALKLVRPEAVAADPTVIARFRREAEAMARLRHPGVVQVLDLLEHQGRPFLVMDYVEGESLRAKLGRWGALPERRATELILEIARALEHVHAHGVVHRDLKPQNVVIRPDGHPVITDFGLALDQSESSLHLTQDGQVVGTPHYMAPEQATGVGPIDAQVDVYALGAVYFELLTGRQPLEGASARTAIERAARGLIPPPRSIVPGLDGRVDTMCRRAMAYDRAVRYPSSAAFAGDLRRWLARSDRIARSGFDAPPPARVRLRRRRVVAVAALTGLGSAAAAFGAAWLVRSGASPFGPSEAVRAEQAAVSSLSERLARAERAAAEPLQRRREEGRARADELARQAREAFDRGDARVARALADEAIRITPRSGAALALRAQCLARDGSALAARDAWVIALQAEPAIVLDHLHGDLDRRHPDVEAAVRRALEEAAASDDAAVAALARAEAAARSGSTEAALAAFDAALVERPGDRRVLLGRAIARWRAGRWDAALEDSARAAEAGADGLVLAIHGRFLHRRRRWDEAARVLARARDAVPQVAEAFVASGWLATDRWRFEEACERFERASRLAPDAARPLTGLAWVSIHQADTRRRGVGPPRRAELIRQAQSLGSQARGLEPERAEAEAALAWTALLSGDEPSGQQHAARAMEIDPRDPCALSARHLALRVASRHDEADRLLADWRAVSPDALALHVLEARWAALLGRPGRARREIERIGRLAPEDGAVAVNALSALLELLGRYDEWAVPVWEEHIERARAHDPDVLDDFCRQHAVSLEELRAVPQLMPKRRRIVETNADFFDRAFAAIERGDLAGAEAIFLERNRIDPPTPWACIELVRLYMRPEAPRALGRGIEELQRAAVEQGRRAVEVTPASGWTEWMAFARSSQALAEAFAGLDDEARASAEQTRADLGTGLFGDGRMDVQALRMLGQAERLLGR